MRVLFITNDYVGQKRAGPAIRCVELAKVLAQCHEVTIAATQPSDIEIEGVRLVSDTLVRTNLLRSAAHSTDIIVTQGLVLAIFPFLQRLGKYLVVDLYDPYLLEHLAHAHPRLPHWAYLRQWHLMNEQLLQGDFFLCANDRQWDYWLGRLCALGRLTPEEYQRDPSFRSVLALVPFGISSVAPQHTKPVAKGIIRGIAPADILLLWAGGIWQWFDPLTVIRAVGLVSQERSDIKLLFLGTQHPNPDIREMPILEEARSLARELRVLDRSVFFREGWVPFDERQNYLLEADMGVSAHLETVEARLAFRTRVLDYIWAGLPMILTQGDYFADLVEKEGLGRTVRPRHVEGWKEALLSLASNCESHQEIRKRLQQLNPKFHWERVSEPLLRYCDEPYHTGRTSRFRTKVVPLLAAGYHQLKRLRDWWR